MPTRIDILTADQQARFPEWVERWVATGLSTERTDFDAVEQAVRHIYQRISLPQPTIILRVSSPWAATVGGAVAANFLAGPERQVRNHVVHQVWNQVVNQVENQVRNHVGHQVWNQVVNQVVNQVENQVGNQVENQVRNQVWNQVMDHMEKRVWDQVRNQVENQVVNQVGHQVWNQVVNQVGHQVRNQVAIEYRNYWGSQFSAPWYSFVTFFRDVCHWENSALQDFALGEALHEAGWVWWHEFVCVIADRPTVLRKNSRGLHCATGPAVAYADGWSIWAWNGVCVTEQIILHPDTLTNTDIAKEANAQVRQVMVERVGIEKVCQMFRAKVLDKKGSYELLNLDLGDGRQRPYLKMLNPSVGVWHVEGVHPTCTTVQHAINWRAGNEKATWTPDVLT